MKLLVTGASGQLGRDVVLCAQRAGDTVFALDRASLDVTDRDSVLGAITFLQPHAVIHCAAWTAVDACESDPPKAMLNNALSVRWVVEGCSRVAAHLVYLSTDYVFDGTKVGAYNEWDTPNPQSVYGASKLAGEIEAAALGASACVVRTSWVSGEFGQNMVKTILRLANERPSLAFVEDQVGHPTLCADLGPLLRQLAIDRRGGVYHATNQGAVSWYQFAQCVVSNMGKSPDMVQGIQSADLQPTRPASRPANSVLDNTAMRCGGLALLPDFRESLAVLVSRLMAG